MQGAVLAYIYRLCEITHKQSQTTKENNNLCNCGKPHEFLPWGNLSLVWAFFALIQPKRPVTYVCFLPCWHSIILLLLLERLACRKERQRSAILFVLTAQMQMRLARWGGGAELSTRPLKHWFGEMSSQYRHWCWLYSFTRGGGVS